MLPACSVRTLARCVSSVQVVEPSKRYTIQQILEHPWVSGIVSVPEVPLTGTIERIKRFNARRRVRAPLL